MTTLHNKLLDCIHDGNLEEIVRLVENNQIDVSIKDNEAFVESVFCEQLKIVQYLSKLPGVDVSAQDHNPFILSVSNANLPMIKYLSTLPGFDASARNNSARIIAAGYGYLETLQYLLTISRVDAPVQNNKALIVAACYGYLEVVEYLLTLPNVDASAQDNQAIMNAYKKGYLSILAMLLYFEPKIASFLSSEDYIKYHQLLLSKLRPFTHKIAISLTELPTPLIIEVIEQSVDFAIYIPYHIKWNMVVAIKHNTPNKN